MEFSALQLADLLHGEVDGDPSVKVSDFSKIEEGRPGTISFLSNPRYEPYIYETQSSVVLVNRDFVPSKPVSATLVRVENAYESLAKLMTLASGERAKPEGISQLASLHATVVTGSECYIDSFASVAAGAVIGDNVQIHSKVSIGENVVIGNNTIIYPGVVIYRDCRIGNNCVLHANAVIGADGFGFAHAEDGSYSKIPQLGNVVLENDVEIGACTTIDRATMGSTYIRRGVKLDNLIQIAHNVEVGEDTVMAAQVGIAGSTKIGKRAMFGGQSGANGHIHIADGSILAARAVAMSAIDEPGKMWSGFPAVPLLSFQRSFIANKNLPELQKTVTQLKKQLEVLEKRLNEEKK